MPMMVNLFFIIAMMCEVIALGGLVFGGMVPVLPEKVAAFMFAGGMGTGMIAVIFCLGCFAAEILQR